VEVHCLNIEIEISNLVVELGHIIGAIKYQSKKPIDLITPPRTLRLPKDFNLLPESNIIRMFLFTQALDYIGSSL
jgi:hypothetical protein